ncbi:hypothetical protein DTL21_10895 [Bremerella cremea]|uniref:Uncharacterized protein n=1 Tax=Blastopirellula marina TaxID=124 RepID=A0A2S8FT32_9BACT|nr:hypothetical protein C5Y83_10890 [Blastopirellula marina]RCS48291.1 hypothetical protein DTL21_10895 [Bremerella cremea]
MLADGGSFAIQEEMCVGSVCNHVVNLTLLTEILEIVVRALNLVFRYQTQECLLSTLGQAFHKLILVLKLT